MGDPGSQRGRAGGFSSCDGQGRGVLRGRWGGRTGAQRDRGFGRNNACGFAPQNRVGYR